MEPGFELIIDIEYSLDTGVGFDDKWDNDRRRGAAEGSKVPGVRKMDVYSGPE